MQYPVCHVRRGLPLYRSGLRPASAELLFPLLTSPLRSTLISQRSVPPQAGSHATSQGTEETSRGKTQNLPRVNAGFIKHTPLADGGLRGHVPTRPGRTTSRLRRDSCSSPRAFGLGFLQTPPHDDALALLLAFGSAKTWHGDFHPISSVPCPAHTLRVRRAVKRRLHPFVGHPL